MDWIEDLFKKTPFIYPTSKGYFIFGNYAIMSMNSSDVNRWLEEFDKAILVKDKDLVKYYFNKLKAKADIELTYSENRPISDTIEKFRLLDFSTEDMESIKNQMEKFIAANHLINN